MQKKLIALAIAGFSGAAFAQSNVTIYGVADATFDFMSVSSGATSANNQSYNRVSTNSSLIGFKGVEDLGNGLKAVFQFESSVGFDNLGGLSANRDSFVALAGGFGTVALGNLTGPTRAFGAAVDVNAGATGIGYNGALLGKLGNVLTGRLDTTVATGGATDQVVSTTCARSSTCVSAFDNRFANAIAYISPDMGGFTAIVGYVPNEGKSAVANPSAWDLGLKYANGPILAGLSHADVKLRNSTAAVPASFRLNTTTGVVDAVPAVAAATYNTHAQDTRLVGSYDFGMGTVRALWDSTKASLDGGAEAKQTVWGLGATFNAATAGKVLFQYYKAKDVTGSAGLGAGSGTGAKFYEIGYEHTLSKRTLLKAVYARLDNDTNARYDLGVNASGLASSDAVISGVQIGLRHTF